MNCDSHKYHADAGASGPVDFSRVRERVTGNNVVYRSLEEAAGTKAFQDFLHREFPSGAASWSDDLSRRHFLKIMGASFALAGFGACTKQPVEKIMPYVKQPPELTPGKPLYYATAMPLGGYANGVIATSHEGRPTKIEGNPDHPSSLGATSVFAQASVLDLYDPDRAQAISHGGRPADWSDFVSAINTEMRAQGNGLRVLTETVTSPTLYSQLQELLKMHPGAKWHQWEPLSRNNVREGARLAFGKVLETQYFFDKANVVLCLDSDFLSTHPDALRFARDFADSRRAGETTSSMSRLYAVEPTPTITGAMADHRLPLAAGDVAAFIHAIAAKLGVAGSAGEPGEHADWIAAVSSDLQKSRGRNIVIAGEQQPPEVHALVHVINQSLGNIGSTVSYIASAEPSPVNQLESLRQLVNDMNSGAVDLLIMIEGNPVFDVPADIDFAAALQKVKTCVRLGSHENETARFCHWHIPATHYLESWSDIRAFDGTASIVQPLIEPLYGGRTSHEILDVLMRQPSRKSYDIVREYWQTQQLPDFEKTWRKALSDGVIADTRSPSAPATPVFTAGTATKPVGTGLEIIFRPDPTILDGRFANNAWLQELPKPFIKLTWENAALISVKLAERENLQNGDMVELRYHGRSVRAPVWIAPGQAENSVTVHLGYGRTSAGRVGSGIGFNGYALRTSDTLWSGGGLELHKTGEKRRLSATQTHFNIEGRDIVRETTLEKFHHDPNVINIGFEPRPERGDTLYHTDEFKYEGYKWGMSIDLSACTGCNACAIACQAENNIPVVGREEVARGREMHWIRVDAYLQGSPDNPEISHQPVPCMHCENAPCELVCPVGATVHDDEGLNVQVYNRCIGTRYCSNNCPYKVRRFNFLEFNAGMTPVQKMVKNPDVTVRSRGVMEKCTYCTQRINAARITAEEEDRKVRDGEIVTACQAACPAQAIIFGDLNDPGSRVSKLKALSLDYWMLGELNTRPRTTYLAKLRNPNPEMKS